MIENNSEKVKFFSTDERLTELRHSSSFCDDHVKHEILYILSKVENNVVTSTELAAILYSIVKKGLLKWGHPLYRYDRFVAYAEGALPERLWSALFDEKESYLGKILSDVIYFDPDYNLTTETEPGLDYISEAWKDVCDKVIEELKGKTDEEFQQIIKDEAWQMTKSGCVILNADIAKIAGGEDSLIAYIQEHDDINECLKCY